MKRILFLHRRTRNEAGRRDEMMEAAQMAAAFGSEVHLAFLDDGVFQLCRTSRAIPADPAEHDIEAVWVEEDALRDRGLHPDDLALPVTVVDAARMAALMAQMDVIVPA